MVSWYLVRHGRTVLNRDNRVQGHSQAPLDEEGIAEAIKLRDRLSDEVFVAAYSSDLMRAQQMIRIVLNDRQITFDMTPDLRELDYGLWEGLSLEHIEAKYKDDMARFMEDDHEFAPPGGESVLHLLERTTQFIDRVKAQVTEGNLLVVCHGVSIRGLVVHLLGLPVTAFWSLKVDLASLSIIDVYPNRAVLSLFNDTSHLRNVSS